MSAAARHLTAGPAAAAPAPLLVSAEKIRRAALWLMMAISSLVLIEPSPYEFMFPVALVAFLGGAMVLRQKLIPLVVLLLLFNIGGVFSLIPFMNEADSVRFIAVSAYISVTAIFFAMIMAKDTIGRLNTIRSGMMVAAWVAAGAGLLGYFDIAGTFEYFTLYGRASGTFKDANVFGPFLVMPIVYVAQRVLCGETGAIRGLLLISVPLAGVFLSFSRGAWGNCAGGLMLAVALLFLTSHSSKLRFRIVVAALGGLVLLIAALLVALSFDSIREVFEMRASLDQSYDLGEQGRFGSQLRAIPKLLDYPNGLGPLRFRFHFPDDPHNVYINAFASYGWLGGFSYFGLVFATCIAGWREVFRRTPWQRHAIVIWSVLFVTILQGFQIDTDHWRHMFLMIGLIWGLAALPSPPPALTPASRAPAA